MKVFKGTGQRDDPAEIRLIRKVVIKERSAEVFRKYLPVPPSPILWEPLKVWAPSRTVIGNWHLIANCTVRRTPFRLRLWFSIVQGLATNSESIANCRKNLFLVSSIVFLLINAAMNAPRLCKLCKDSLTCTGHGAMVYKTHQFLNFLIAKPGTKTMAH